VTLARLDCIPTRAHGNETNLTTLNLTGFQNLSGLKSTG